jgi:polyhydroxybutyrate depolymerase
MIPGNFLLKRACALGFFLLIAVGLCGGSVAAELPLATRSWTVDGTQRTALVHIPPNALPSPCPVLFAFHGHGGSMGQAAWNFGYHRLWPEAIVVYMQGLPTPSKLVDPKGLKPGWQNHTGDQADRDLHFFDAVLASLRKEFKVDEHRIFAAGHSNGGMFTYLLWASRGNELAAIAPSAAFAPPWAVRLVTPKPVFHLGGRQDQLVRFAWQERTMNAIRLLNGCSATGVPWAKSGTLECTMYSSRKSAPFVSGIHDGDHKFPAEAPELIVRFFKEQPMK